MERCEKVDLLKLQGQYLGFLVANHTELNVLEHIEECGKCREKIFKSIKNEKTLPEFGNLFQRSFEDQSISQYKDYKNINNFINARIQWRKRKLKKIIEDAEIELKDLETRL